MRVGQATILLLTLVSSACASLPQPSPNAAAFLTPLERVGLPGVMYSDVIETVGTPTVAAEPVVEGAALLSFAYRYRHTAVLAEDVKGFSITVPGVQAPAGSPGYFAGAFGAYRGNVRTSPPQELWCFLPSAVGGKRDNICLLRSALGIAAIAPTRIGR
jgi:hypothetical protein